MDSQCKCHSGGTNIFRFYDKHKCIINLDLARNTELVPNIHMSYRRKDGKIQMPVNIYRQILSTGCP